jgi:hypothetical protein
MKLNVDVTSDVIYPWCLVGKRRLEKAVAAVAGKHEVVVRWHPFQLNSNMPGEGIERRAYPGLLLLVLHNLVLPDYREAEFPQYEVCLPRGLAAAELVGPQHTPDRVLAGQPDHGPRGVPLAVAENLVCCRGAERVVRPGVQVGHRLQNVFPGQTGRDRLRHGKISGRTQFVYRTLAVLALPFKSVLEVVYHGPPGDVALCGDSCRSSAPCSELPVPRPQRQGPTRTWSSPSGRSRQPRPDLNTCGLSD